jgi:hypothetical protein
MPVDKKKKTMAKCFIIQPFDGGKFDKRFSDIYKPAIINAGLEPYRVDMDINSVIPIEEIDKGIKESAVCLADITIDNPNVWFELGLSIAYGKDTILICSEERTTKFPFDVQHRKIIRYLSESPSDFERLKKQIEDRIKAYIKKSNGISQLAKSVVKQTEGLDPSEIVCLVTIAENIDNPDDGVSAYTIKNENENAGYTKIATTLALKKLLNMQYISFSLENDCNNYNSNDYTAYHVTESGLQWLLENKDKLILKLNESIKDSVIDDVPF